jgi:hypothetical protein
MDDTLEDCNNYVGEDFGTKLHIWYFSIHSFNRCLVSLICALSQVVIHVAGWPFEQAPMPHSPLPPPKLNTDIEILV